MAQRTPSGTSRRVTGAPLKKPFPWGFAFGCALVAVALAGILVYAFQNTGAGFRTAADKLDDSIDGVEVDKDLTFEHVPGRVSYSGAASAPPVGGDHNEIPQSCAVYSQGVVNEHAVHSLEHGAVWVTYRPDLPADQVERLKGLVEGNEHRMLSPYPGQAAAVSLQAWGRRLTVDSAGDQRVEAFLDGYTAGPQTREPGAQCAGVDVPGTAPFVAGPNGQFLPEGQVLPSPTPRASAPAKAPSAPAPTPTASS